MNFRCDDYSLFNEISNSECLQMLECMYHYKRHYDTGNLILPDASDVMKTGIIIKGSVDLIYTDHHSLIKRFSSLSAFGESDFFLKCKGKFAFIASDNCDILFFTNKRILHTCSRQCIYHNKFKTNLSKLLNDIDLLLIDSFQS